MAVSAIGAAHFLSRRFDQALPKLLLAIQENRTPPAEAAFHLSV
jgi:hypothetical protein